MFAILRFILPVGVGVGQGVVTDGILKRIRNRYRTRTVLLVTLGLILLFFIF